MGLEILLNLMVQIWPKTLQPLAVAFNEINLSEFTSTSNDALTAAFIADILSDSGFKYNAATTAQPSMGLTYDRTISTDADAYSMGGFPAGIEQTYMFQMMEMLQLELLE